MHRHVELVAAQVLEHQELREHVVHVERHQPSIAADAVIFVHDRSADLQVGELANHGLGIACAPPPLALPRPLHTELGCGDHAQPARRDPYALRELRDGHREMRVAGEELLPTRDHRGLEAAVAHEVEHHLAVPGRRGREQRALLRRPTANA